MLDKHTGAIMDASPTTTADSTQDTENSPCVVRGVRAGGGTVQRKSQGSKIKHTDTALQASKLVMYLQVCARKDWVLLFNVCGP